jgi:hypothetical protein
MVTGKDLEGGSHHLFNTTNLHGETTENQRKEISIRTVIIRDQIETWAPLHVKSLSDRIGALKTTKAEEITSMLIIQWSISVNTWHQVLYQCLEERTVSHVSYICGCLNVFCKSIVSFSAQRQLRPGCLGLSSR